MSDKFLTEEDIDLIELRLKEVFITKDDFTEYKSDLFTKLDEIIKNTRDTNEEVELVENRVTKLETKLAS